MERLIRLMGLPDFQNYTTFQWTTLAITIVLLVAIGWKIFEKADEPGWKTLIPFYNTYEMFRITSGTGWYFIMLFFPLGIVRIVGQMMLAIFVGRAFRKGTLFKLGMFFLPVIFYGILALSDDRFYGINGMTHTPADNGSKTVDFETVSEDFETVTSHVAPEEVVTADEIDPIEEPTTIIDVDVDDVETIRNDG